MPKKNDSSSVDIIQLLTETTEKEKKRREEFLVPLNIKEFFAEGSITINKKTCQGVECKLWIKACPTNALYWKTEEVGVTEELCVHCGASVLSCIVDDRIKIVRKRSNGETESFSKPKEFITHQHRIDTKNALTVLETFLQKWKTIRN